MFYESLFHRLLSFSFLKCSYLGFLSYIYSCLSGSHWIATGVRWDPSDDCDPLDDCVQNERVSEHNCSPSIPFADLSVDFPF